jgi:hypothetical protein
VWRAAIDADRARGRALIAHVDGRRAALEVVVTGGWSRDAAVFDAKRRLGAIEAPPVVEAGAAGRLHPAWPLGSTRAPTTCQPYLPSQRPA